MRPRFSLRWGRPVLGCRRRSAWYSGPHKSLDFLTMVVAIGPRITERGGHIPAFQACNPERRMAFGCVGAGLRKRRSVMMFRRAIVVVGCLACASLAFGQGAAGQGPGIGGPQGRGVRQPEGQREAAPGRGAARDQGARNGGERGAGARNGHGKHGARAMKKWLRAHPRARAWLRAHPEAVERLKAHRGEARQGARGRAPAVRGQQSGRGPGAGRGPGSARDFGPGVQAGTGALERRGVGPRQRGAMPRNESGPGPRRPERPAGDRF